MYLIIILNLVYNYLVRINKNKPLGKVGEEQGRDYLASTHWREHLFIRDINPT